jgi:hypothetical protein
VVECEQSTWKLEQEKLIGRKDSHKNSKHREVVIVSCREAEIAQEIYISIIRHGGNSRKRI